MSSPGDQTRSVDEPAAPAQGEAAPHPQDTGRRRRRKRAQGIHPLLERQLMEAANAEGRLQVRKLIAIVSRQYQSFESDRNSLATVMQIAAEEANAMTEAIARETASRLQAILDNVKDGIISCDSLGRIESMNRTAERFFGVKQADMRCSTIDVLLPEIAPGGEVAEALEDLAAEQEDAHFDRAARNTEARHGRGGSMPAEILVSKTLLGERVSYIVCVRDALERDKAELALKDSEARYRVLVEHAPEAVVVFDALAGRFVDCNENATRFFGMSRAELLRSGPAQLAAPRQPDDGFTPLMAAEHLRAALDGGAPVFEWLHRDAEGREIPTEVRLVRLPSSSRQLIRGSILDITERKRAERIAAGERQVFERIASHAELSDSLHAITDVIEQVLPQSMCCIRLYDRARAALIHAAGRRLPREYVLLMEDVPAQIRYGSCAAAVALDRQVIVPDIGQDPFWEFRREAAARFGLAACWSTPIRSAQGEILGTFATYRKRSGLPSRRDLELMARMSQLARIAIERSRAEEALRASEQRYRGLFDNVVEGVYQASRDGALLSANPALVEMLGYDSFEALQALGGLDRLHADPAERKDLLETLLRDGELVGAETCLKRRDGASIVVSENARVNRDARGEIVGFEGTVTDVTERRRAETRLFEEKERAQVTLQSIVDAVITTDRDGMIDYLNPVAEALTGWASAEAVGRAVGEVVRLTSESTQEATDDPVSRVLREREAITLSDQTMLEAKDGGATAIQANAAPIRDRDGEIAGAVMVFHDVSRERRMRRLLSYQAAHDALTGLLNRREFENRLSAAIDAARGDPSLRQVMVYLDLDQFKVVNDTCGHPAGDQLLRQVTGLLQSRVRVADTLARLGGDEFGILLGNCSIDMAMRLADGLRQAIRDYRFAWHGTSLQVGVSIGLVEVTHHTESVASLLAAADVACYSAKDGGRNRVNIYDPESASARHQEMRWVARLTSASEEGRLSLVWQPIERIADGGVGRPHYELLLRLRDEEGRTVLPSEFIPAAERYNVMPILDRWVVEQVLEALVPSRRDGLLEEAPYTIAINISGATLSDQSFIEWLIDELERKDPVPGTLCFEVTETAAIVNLAKANYIIRELTRRGCLVSLDDFGTGLSSFNYLRNLPVHYLKIDGEFVQNVAEDRVDRSLVEAIVQIARAMGIETVAERVERQEVLDMLKAIGVGYVQGYLTGRPAPLSEFPQPTRGPEPAPAPPGKPEAG